MLRLIQAPAAEADAVEIWVHIAQDNPDAADRLLDRFDQLFRLLASQPHVGQRIEKLALNLRFVPLGNYLIFYRPTADAIEIARILHGARDITSAFFGE